MGLEADLGQAAERVQVSEHQQSVGQDPPGPPPAGSREQTIPSAKAGNLEIPDEHAAVGRCIWWNFWVISLDAAFWVAGMACMDSAAVLPVFVSTLTDSKLVIGFLTALPGVGWTLPQLIGVAGVMHRPRKKGYLLKVAAVGRTPALILPALLLLTPLPDKTLMLWALVGCYSLLFLSDGVIGVAWYDIIGKTIPARMRGRFFAAMSILGGVGALGSGWLVKRVLASPALTYPRQYGVLLACMCAGFFLSYLLLAMIREPQGAVMSEEVQPLREIIRWIPRIWKNSPPFRGVLIISWLGSLASLAWPFYSLHGMKALNLPIESGAAFIWAGTLGSMIGSPVWAWVNDRRGPRSVIVGCCAMKLTAPALALLVPIIVPAHPALAAPRVAQYLYASVFFCGGMLMGGLMMGFANFLLELASPAERPLYIGLGNTLTAPGLLTPLLGGWLASVWSYPGLLVVAAALGVVTLAYSFTLPAPALPLAGLPQPGPKEHPAPYLPPESDRRLG